MFKVLFNEQEVLSLKVHRNGQSPILEDIYLAPGWNWDPNLLRSVTSNKKGSVAFPCHVEQKTPSCHRDGLLTVRHTGTASLPGVTGKGRED